VERQQTAGKQGVPVTRCSAVVMEAALLT
jgi:hypothetical protein